MEHAAYCSFGTNMTLWNETFELNLKQLELFLAHSTLFSIDGNVFLFFESNTCRSEPHTTHAVRFVFLTFNRTVQARQTFHPVIMKLVNSRLIITTGKQGSI